MTIEQTEQRSFSTVELIQGLRDLAKIGIVNARRDTALLNQAADRMEELAWYKINLLPLPARSRCRRSDKRFSVSGQGMAGNCEYAKKKQKLKSTDGNTR